MSRKKDVINYIITRHEIHWTRVQNNDLHRINIFNVLLHNETNRVHKYFFGEIDNERTRNGKRSIR